MIASELQQLDRELYLDYLGIIKIVAEIVKKHPEQEHYLKQFIENAKKLRHKIDTYDYFNG